MSNSTPRENKPGNASKEAPALGNLEPTILTEEVSAILGTVNASIEKALDVGSVIVIQEALRIAGDRRLTVTQEAEPPQDEEGQKSVLEQNSRQMLWDYADNHTSQDGHDSASRTSHNISGSHFAEILSTTRLLHHLSRILQDQIDKDKKRTSFLDRKLKRKIDEKKQAQGIKQ